VQLGEIMNTRLISVNTSTDQEDVARLVARYDVLALPVVDDENKLVGIITVDDVIDIIRDEETEDMLLMAGVGEGDEEEVLRAPVWKNALQRFPWLLAAFGGGIGAWQIYEYYAGGLGGSTDGGIPLIIVLAGFMPIIAGMGGNSGTQSATIVVRGLATGRIHEGQDARVVVREVAVAMSMGVTFGVLLALVAGIVSPDTVTPQMRGVLGLAIAVSMTTAALVGATVPMLIRRLGFDPAIATGPVITTAIDVVGVAAYFFLASLLLAS